MVNFNTRQAADYLKETGTPFTRQTLEVWRSLGRGPRYKRVGRRIFYEQTDLDSFAKGRKVETIDSVGLEDQAA